VILDSTLLAANTAVKEYAETKQRQELEALGLYCSNCEHLKRKMFSGPRCGVSGWKTSEAESCANHSDYARRRYKPAAKPLEGEFRYVQNKLPPAF
jgi:hypothetical protein